LRSLQFLLTGRHYQLGLLVAGLALPLSALQIVCSCMLYTAVTSLVIPTAARYGIDAAAHACQHAPQRLSWAAAAAAAGDHLSASVLLSTVLLPIAIRTATCRLAAWVTPLPPQRPPGSPRAACADQASSSSDDCSAADARPGTPNASCSKRCTFDRSGSGGSNDSDAPCPAGVAADVGAGPGSDQRQAGACQQVPGQQAFGLSTCLIRHTAPAVELSSASMPPPRPAGSARVSRQTLLSGTALYAAPPASDGGSSSTSRGQQSVLYNSRARHASLMVKFDVAAPSAEAAYAVLSQRGPVLVTQAVTGYSSEHVITQITAFPGCVAVAAHVACTAESFDEPALHAALLPLLAAEEQLLSARLAPAEQLAAGAGARVWCEPVALEAAQLGGGTLGAVHLVLPKLLSKQLKAASHSLRVVVCDSDKVRPVVRHTCLL
jgi:hypothetical protein